MSKVSFFFFFNDTATTEIYTLSLHDALPIFGIDRVTPGCAAAARARLAIAAGQAAVVRNSQDRKSTRLNSSHSQISYAVFCLKKKKNTPTSSSREDIYGCLCQTSPVLVASRV